MSALQLFWPSYCAPLFPLRFSREENLSTHKRGSGRNQFFGIFLDLFICARSMRCLRHMRFVNGIRVLGSTVYCSLYFPLSLSLLFYWYLIYVLYLLPRCSHALLVELTTQITYWHADGFLICTHTHTDAYIHLYRGRSSVEAKRETIKMKFIKWNSFIHLIYWRGFFINKIW